MDDFYKHFLGSMFEKLEEKSNLGGPFDTAAFAEKIRLAESANIDTTAFFQRPDPGSIRSWYWSLCFSAAHTIHGGNAVRGETVRSCDVCFCQCGTFAGIASCQHRACIPGCEAGSHADAARAIGPIAGTGLKGQGGKRGTYSPGSARIVRLEEIARQAEQGWKLVAVEWERELPAAEGAAPPPGEVPVGWFRSSTHDFFDYKGSRKVACK